MPARPFIVITQEMIEEANRFIPATLVPRTRASQHDTLTGNLGELIFAQFFHGDFRRHKLGQTKGETDFPDIEIKTSAHPFRQTLHLLIRSDYETRRRPPFYVLVVLDVEKPKAPPQVGCKAILCGYCSWKEARWHGHERSFATGDGGFICLAVPMQSLHKMSQFGAAYRKHSEKR